MNAFQIAQQCILQPIAALGYSAYVTGGFCRDMLLSVASQDIDIVTNAPIAVLEHHFTVLSDISKNFPFGIVLIEVKGHRFEVAQFRLGQAHADHFLPGAAHPAPTFFDDAQRRDFTCNAIGIDATGNIVDYFNGKQDIENGVLRAVGDAADRFAEDYLRILRAVRLVVTYSFTLEAETERAIRECAACVNGVAAERIFGELEKMAALGGKRFADAIDLLFELGILQHILPEVAELNNWEHSPEHHPEGNVYQHTLAAIRQSQSTIPLVNFAILLHDVGKAKTHRLREKDGKTYHSYFCHDVAGVTIINEIANRLKFSHEYRDACSFAAEKHMIFHSLTDVKTSKLVALMQCPYFDILYQVAKCDSKSRLQLYDQEKWHRIDARISAVREKYFSATSPLRYVSGKKVMELTGIATGARIGRIIAQTKDWVVNTECTDFAHIDRRIIALAKSTKKNMKR